jgi:phage terminase large subunit
MSTEATLDPRIARAMLWNKGIINWKLEKVQKDLYDAYHAAQQKTIVWSCSRRLGKSYALCVLAVEKCLSKPNCIVKYVAPTQKHVKTIIKPLLKEILKDCPKDIKPEFKTADNLYRFRNGSEIQLAGTDNGHAEGLRGGSSDICIVDEAGFCDDLKYIVQSILIPTTTTTRGKIILSSTPPRSPDHEFNNYVEDAELKGSYTKKTIFDAVEGDGSKGRITLEIIKELADEYGGYDSVEFRREYMCERIVSEESAVIPEFSEQLQKKIIKEWSRPPFFDVYVGGDIGFKDLTVFLFGYYDFRAAKIIIEDEVVMNGSKMTTEVMAAQIKETEARLYTHPMTKVKKEPYLRTCDNNLIVINDLYKLHGLTFQPTAKDDSSAALNNLRIMIKEEKIIIHPRCKTLIHHMRNATWAKSGKMNRSPDAGHYDAVDAAKYLVRNVQITKNPYPANYGAGSGDDWFDPNANKPASKLENDFKNIFKIKPSFKAIRK